MGQSGKIQVTKVNSQEKSDLNSSIKITFDSIQEKDSNGNIIGKSGKAKHSFNNFASLDFTVSSITEGDCKGVECYKLDFQSTGIVNDNDLLKVEVFIFKASGDIHTAGEEGEEATDLLSVEEGDVKFNIIMENWTWCVAESECSDSESNCCKQVKTYEIGEFIDFTLAIEEIAATKSDSTTTSDGTGSNESKDGETVDAEEPEEEPETAEGGDATVEETNANTDGNARRNLRFLQDVEVTNETTTDESATTETGEAQEGKTKTQEGETAVAQKGETKTQEGETNVAQKGETKTQEGETNVAQKGETKTQEVREEAIEIPEGAVKAGNISVSRAILPNKVEVDGEFVDMPKNYPMIIDKGSLKSQWVFRFPKFSSKIMYDPVVTMTSDSTTTTSSKNPTTMTSNSDSTNTNTTSSDSTKTSSTGTTSSTNTSDDSKVVLESNTNVDLSAQTNVKVTATVDGENAEENENSSYSITFGLFSLIISMIFVL